MKVCRVRWCVQCEEMLPDRCQKCVKHPNRRPRVVEIFGVPGVISTNACGCVKINCQNPGCARTMWRHPLADGTLKHKNHFCSPGCVRIVTAAARRAARISSLCSCGCRRQVVRPMSNMRAKHIYFSQKCHYVHRTKLKSEEIQRLESCDVQALACYSDRCAGQIRDHVRNSAKLMICPNCKNGRKDDIERMVTPMVKVVS